MIFQKLTKAAVTNKTAIMTGIGCGCTVLAVIFSHDDTLKAERLLDKHYDEQLTAKEKAKLTWKCYIPTALVTCASVSMMIATHKAHLGTEAKLMATLAFVDGQRRELMDLVGEDKLKDISKDNAKNSIPDDIPVKGKMWCYEPETKQWFQATTEQILMAEITANKMFKNEGKLTINDFLNLLPGTHKVPWGDYFGWYTLDENGEWDYNWSFYRGDPWIDIQPIITTIDGRDALMIGYGMHPGDNPDCNDE